jgi:hypothetical protein
VRVVGPNRIQCRPPTGLPRGRDIEVVVEVGSRRSPAVTFHAD